MDNDYNKSSRNPKVNLHTSHHKSYQNTNNIANKHSSLEGDTLKQANKFDLEVDNWTNLRMIKYSKIIRILLYISIVISIIITGLSAFLVNYTDSALMITFLTAILISICIMMFGFYVINNYKELVSDYIENKNERDPEDIENSNERTFLSFYIYLVSSQIIVFAICCVGCFVSEDQIRGTATIKYADSDTWKNYFGDRTLEEGKNLLKNVLIATGVFGVIKTILLIAQLYFISSFLTALRRCYVLLCAFSCSFTVLALGLLYFSIYCLKFVDFISESDYNPVGIFKGMVAISSLAFLVGIAAIFFSYYENETFHKISLICVCILGIIFLVFFILCAISDKDFRRYYEGKCAYLISKFNYEYLVSYAKCYNGKYYNRTSDLSSFNCDKSLIVVNWESNLGIPVNNQKNIYGCLTTSCCETTLSYIKDKIDFLSLLCFIEVIVSCLIVYYLVVILLRFSKSKKDYSQKRHFILVLLIFTGMIIGETIIIGLLPKPTSASPLDVVIEDYAPSDNSNIPQNITGDVNSTLEFINLRNDLIDDFNSIIFINYYYIETLIGVDSSSSTDYDINESNVDDVYNNNDDNKSLRLLSYQNNRILDDTTDYSQYLDKINSDSKISIVKECQNCTETYRYDYKYTNLDGNGLLYLKNNNSTEIFVLKNTTNEIHLVTVNDFIYNMNILIDFEHICKLELMEVVIEVTATKLPEGTIYTNSSDFSIPSNVKTIGLIQVQELIKGYYITNLTKLKENESVVLKKYDYELNYVNTYRQILGRTYDIGNNYLSNVTIDIKAERFPECFIESVYSQTNGYFFTNQLYILKNSILVDYTLSFIKTGYYRFDTTVAGLEATSSRGLNLGKITLLNGQVDFKINIETTIYDTNTNSPLNDVYVYAYKGNYKLKVTSYSSDNLDRIDDLIQDFYSDDSSDSGNSYFASTQSNSDGKIIIPDISHTGDISMIFIKGGYYKYLYCK